MVSSLNPTMFSRYFNTWHPGNVTSACINVDKDNVWLICGVMDTASKMSFPAVHHRRYGVVTSVIRLNVCSSWHVESAESMVAFISISNRLTMCIAVADPVSVKYVADVSQAWVGCPSYWYGSWEAQQTVSFDKVPWRLCWITSCIVSNHFFQLWHRLCGDGAWVIVPIGSWG